MPVSRYIKIDLSFGDLIRELRIANISGLVDDGVDSGILWRIGVVGLCTLVVNIEADAILLVVGSNDPSVKIWSSFEVVNMGSNGIGDGISFKGKAVRGFVRL
jgi:hypothetical protein